VEDAYPRRDVQLLSAPREVDAAARVLTLEPIDPAYTCSACGSLWHYQQVRNTGRCPTCGSGLLRDGDCP
jgi:DNA-directed RNA polymerase subunit RPC12/RpoP